MSMKTAFRVFIVALFAGLGTLANADVLVNLRFTDPVNNNVGPGNTPGPISFGLSELPSEVHASILLAGTPDPNDITTYFDRSDVLSSSLTFGDGDFDTIRPDTGVDPDPAMPDFAMSIYRGEISSLKFTFSPILTPSVSNGVIVMNSPLRIIGVDTASDEDFSYTYANSVETFSVVPEPSTLAIISTIGLIASVGRRRRA